jgi:hypothetical protein
MGKRVRNKIPCELWREGVERARSLSCSEDRIHRIISTLGQDAPSRKDDEQFCKSYDLKDDKFITRNLIWETAKRGEEGGMGVRRESRE